LETTVNFKRVLITGAAGLLGGSIVEELRGRCEVSGFDLKTGATPIQWHIGSLDDEGAVAAAVRGQDVVMHVAAIPNIWSGSGDRIMQVNVLGLHRVFSAAEAAGVKRIVLCSSDSVVGFTVREGALRPPAYLPIDIDHPLKPTDPYGLSKLLGEEIARSFALRGKLEVVVLRPVFIAYPEMYGEIRARSASPETYSGTRAGGPSSAGGGPCWHHVDPRDVATAFRMALELEDVSFERFFVSANVTLSPVPTLVRLREVLGALPPVRKPDVYAQNPFAPLFDLSNTRERLKFEPRFDARDISISKLSATEARLTNSQARA
jgi:nucleoside-diphosphate-sugar epimerase